MTAFGPIFGSAYNWPYGPGAITRVEAPPDPKEAATPNEPAERNAWTATAAAGFPGFGKAPPGTPGLYWQMRKYSACVLAFASTTGPIFGGNRTLEIYKDGEDAPANKRPGGPLAGDGPTEAPEDKFKAARERHYKPLWPEILNGLECLNLGAWLQEVLWDRVSGETLPVRFKDFLWNEFTLAVDPYGDFAGYRPLWAGVDFGKPNENDRTPPYALLHVHQPHLNRVWGMPRLENCREDWWRAVKTDDNIAKMEQKASGISLLILWDQEYEFFDGSGNKVSAQTAGQNLLNALARGDAAMAPRYTFRKKDIQGKPELAEHKPIDATQFDWGSTAPAILAGISALDARDTRIMRGFGRPEREAMQGKHGTNAESDTQGQLAVLDSEKVHAERVAQFNQQTWRYDLQTNAPQYIGRMQWVPTPLTDADKSFYQSLALALAGAAGSTFSQRIDEPDLMKKLELKPNADFVPMPQLPNEPVPPEGGPAPQDGGGSVPVRQNGQPAGANGNGRMRQMGLSAAWGGDGDEEGDDGRDWYPLALNCGTGAGGFAPGNTCGKGGRQYVVDRVTRKGMVMGRAADESPNVPAVELGHVSEFTAAEPAQMALSAAPLPEFADKVQAIGDKLPGFGDNKVYLSHVYAAAHAEDPSLTAGEFKTKMKAANTENLLKLSRADIPLNPGEEAKSEIDLGHGATAHFLLVKSDANRRQVARG